MPGKNRLSPCTGALPVGAPSVVPAGMLVAPPREPAAGGPAGGVMSRNAEFMAALTLVAVVASGDDGVTTVPMRVGGVPAQAPKPAVPAPPGTITSALQLTVGLASTTSPLIVVAPVLVIPAVD